MDASGPGTELLVNREVPNPADEGQTRQHRRTLQQGKERSGGGRRVSAIFWARGWLGRYNQEGDLPYKSTTVLFLLIKQSPSFFRRSKLLFFARGV